ncbi:MAG TPA: cytochrome c [Lacipirellulaceae bacterium]|nr:cytochrome c [Lacipirellulaceae bacterium]
MAAFVGCGKADPPQFRLNMMNVVAKQVAPQHQQAIANILGAMFGTPDKPYAMPETGLDQKKLNMAAGPVWSDQAGEDHGLYRRHCAHCHGISGDGHGPTADILNPYPRDYRPGVFKFKSTYTSAEPTEADLLRIVHDGIPGTAMPSFALLPPDQRAALVEYVKYLSIRGEMEKALEDYVADNLDPGDKFDPASNAETKKLILDDMLKPIVEAWQTAKDQVIVPDEKSIPPDNRTVAQIADSADKGRELFYGTQANCVKCHGPTALGDGQQDDYSDWNKATHDFIQATNAKLAEMEALRKDLTKAKGDDAEHIKEQIRSTQKEYKEREAVIATLLPPRHAIPRNLREGILRGGRRPIDIFWRISAGIRGMPMPASGPAAPGAPGTLTQEQIWQLVDYVQSLPFEPASQPLKKGPVNSSAVSTGE